nr:recombinase zinc beta ribbon domain-containing protein [uncultured Brevundimonas sp.]
MFSGKIMCGLCGEKYNVLSGSLGCVGRALKGSGCGNTRRTRREDLESAVVQGLASRLLDAELLDKVVGEDRAEAQRACEQQRATIDRAVARTRILETKSTNIRGQLSEMDPKSQSAALMREDLEEVLSELETAKRTSRQAAAAMPTAKSTAEIIAALQLAIANLQQLLTQVEPEAARARDKLRALVDEIVVLPFDDGHQDGRGAGPVVVTVVGWLSQLLELADGPVGRVFMSREGTQTCQEHANLQVFYSVEIINERSDAACQVADDAHWIRRLLVRSAEPLRQQDLLRRFREERSPTNEKEDILRVRRALERMGARGQLVRNAVGREVIFGARLYRDPYHGTDGAKTVRATPAFFKQVRFSA